MSAAFANNAEESSRSRYTCGTGPGGILVIFVLGGPGAGKGTQCARLARDHGFKHFSVGDMLREEQRRPGSDIAELIATCMMEGLTISGDVTVRLLESAISAAMEEGKTNKFLIDGFPRRLEQVHMFEDRVVRSRCTLLLECPESILRNRLQARREATGRSDDNEESIFKRLITFRKSTVPVLEAFNREGRLLTIDSSDEKDNVYARIEARLAQEGVLSAKPRDA